MTIVRLKNVGWEEIKKYLFYAAAAATALDLIEEIVLVLILPA